MNQKDTYRLAVIGGGASGLIAAVRAVQLQRSAGQPVSVIVLEGCTRPGRKLLATGNGRCNLTNMAAARMPYFGDARLAARVLQSCPPQTVRDYFKSLGLLTKADDAGRVYPCCEQASAVLHTLCSALEEWGGTLQCDTRITKIRKAGGTFLLQPENGPEIRAQRVIVAGGGQASPKLGCGVDAASLVQALGHTVTPRFPALVRIASDDVPASLKGVRIKTAVTLLADRRPVASSDGEAIFGAGSLSGICVMQLSRQAAQWKATGMVGRNACRALTLSMDLAPDQKEQELTDWLCEFAQSRPKLAVEHLLDGVLPARLAAEAAHRCRLKGEAGRALRAEIAALVRCIKSYELRVSGTGGWDDAQVTAGGVPLRELDLRTMQSKCCPGLYVVGELCNVDGDCGGFNLQWAWTTGLLAAQDAAMK